MQTDLQSLVQTWENPDKKLVFQGYAKIPFPLKTILVLVGSIVTLNFFNKVGAGAAKFPFMKYLGLFSFAFFLMILYQVFQWVNKQHQHRFFKKQDFYDDEIFMLEAAGTTQPCYHEVLKAERPDLSKAPPEFQQFSDAARIVFVITKVLHSTHPNHQSVNRWVCYVEPGESIPLRPGDHLISLHGNKSKDNYAVHAQSCNISSDISLPKITIPSEGVLLSLNVFNKTFLYTEQRRKEQNGELNSAVRSSEDSDTPLALSSDGIHFSLDNLLKLDLSDKKDER